MATIKEALDNVTSLVAGVEGEIQNVMDSNKSLVREFVTEQLYSGVNGNDKPLRPAYLNDPWFSTDEAGKWKNNAKGYAKMKKRITKPTPSFQGYPARDIYTPNLILPTVQCRQHHFPEEPLEISGKPHLKQLS